MSEPIIAMETRPNGHTRRRRILATMAITLAIAVMPLLAARALYNDEGISRNAFLTELALPLIHLLVLAAAVLFIARTGTAGNLDITWWRRRCSEGRWTLLFVPVAISVYEVVGWLLQRIGLQLSPDTWFWGDEQRLIFYVAVTIASIVLTPVVEELFWRGYVQTTLTRLFGGFGGLFGQAFLFSATHMRPFGGFISVFVLGLITGVWRWRRRTLVPIIVAHMAVNSLWCMAQWPQWLDFMRIRVTTDYIGEMSQLAKPADYDPNADACLEYEKALRLLVQMPRELNAVRGGYPADWSEDVRAAVHGWITANQQALDCVVQGANKPYHWPAYKDRDTILFPESQGLRTLALALGMRVKVRASEGEHEQMCSDIATLYRLGGHFCGTKTFVHQCIGMYIRRMSLSILQQVLARESLSAYTLAGIQDRFEQMADSNDYVIDFSLQRLTCLDDIQRLFTDEGNGNGHIPKGAFRRNALPHDQEQGLLRLRREETARAVQEFFRVIHNARNMTPWQLHKDPNTTQLALQNLLRDNAYLEWRVGTLAPTMEEAWRNRTHLDAMIAILSAIRYKADHGQYPDSLEQLVADGYLKEIPRDPFSNGPLIYNRFGDRFVLYSCGADFDDNGGRPSKWGEGKDGGDQVFWPVAQETQPQPVPTP